MSSRLRLASSPLSQNLACDRIEEYRKKIEYIDLNQMANFQLLQFAQPFETVQDSHPRDNLAAEKRAEVQLAQIENSTCGNPTAKELGLRPFRSINCQVSGTWSEP